MREAQARRAWWRRYGVEIGLVLVTLAVVGPVVAPDSAQPASRYALTAALAEKQSVDISGYPLGVDRAVYEGKLRSDKAPGQPALAVPFFMLADAFGADDASYLREHGNLGLWFVTLTTAGVPFAILLVLMYRGARRIVPAPAALGAALVVGAGGLLLPYSAHLFGHVLGALLGFAAWYVLEPDPGDRRRLLAAGALAGASVTVEYHGAIVAGVLLCYAAYRVRRTAAWMLVGAVPFACALGLYHWRAFGAPWRLPFEYFAGEIDGTTEGGYTIPGVQGFADLFTGPHGLLVNAPLVLVAVIALVTSVRGDVPAAVRRNGWVAIAVLAPLVFLVAGWSGTPTLETPGPRYLAPAIPFLAVPIAYAWTRWGRVFALAGIFGALVALGAVFGPINSPSAITPIEKYAQLVSDGDLSPTIWSMAAGRAGILVYLALVAGAVAFLARAVARTDVASAPVADLVAR